MSQICVDGNWNGELTWTRSSLEGETSEANRLLAIYEEGNVKAQSGDLPAALKLFQQGLGELQAKPELDEHLRVAEAALLWGLGTALDRSQKGEQGWQTLLNIVGPGASRKKLPLGLAINWSHSATLAGFRHGRFEEVCAVLDAMHRLGCSDQLRDSKEAAAAVRERYLALAPFRARSFEGLMKAGRFEQATAVAARCLATVSQYEADDKPTLSFWTDLEQAAKNRDATFELEEPDETKQPAVRVLWTGEDDEPKWRLEEAPEDPHLSSLARLYSEAAHLADRGDQARALALYDEGLEAWCAKAKPSSADGVVGAMMLWGKATLQDRAAENGSPEAWETLMRLAHPDVGVALPLPLLLRWLGSSVIVGTHLKRWAQVRSLLAMLIAMALHPQLGQRDRELHGELIHRFLDLLEGVYGGMEANPVEAADWVRSLQDKIEPSGLILLPLRDLLYHALSAAERHGEAATVALEVVEWARREGDPRGVQEWEGRARAATARSAG